MAGMIIFALIPILPFYEGTKVTPETMRYLVMVAGVLVLPALYLMMRHAPLGVRRLDQASASENPFHSFMTLRYNKPALWYMGSVIFHAVATAFYMALAFIVLDSYLGLGQFYVYIILFQLVFASLVIKPAVSLIMRVGKIRASMLSYLICILISLIYVPVLFNTAYTLMLIFIFVAVWAIASSIINVASFSLLSDIADYGTLQSGVDRTASYFALWSLSGKTCMALGIAVSLAIAGWFGFDPKAGTHPPQVFWGLILCMCIIPILCNLLANFCLSKITITSRRHDIIRRRLDAQAARISHAEVNEPQTTSAERESIPGNLPFQTAHEK